MPDTARAALLPAVLTVLAVASQYVPVVAMGTGPPAWLPDLGSTAVTVAVFQEVAFAVGTVLVLAGAFAMGYYEGKRPGTAETYWRYVAVVCGAATAALLAVVATLVLVGGQSLPLTLGMVLTVATLLVAIPVVLTVSALAGVSYAAVPSDGPTASRRSLAWVAAAAALVTGVAVVLGSVADLAIAFGDGVGVAEPLPTVGSVGTTVVTYSQASQLASDLALVGGGTALGVFAVRRTPVGVPTRGFVTAVAAGAVVGLAVAQGAVGWTLANAASDLALASLLASIPTTLLDTACVATLAAIAGVGVERLGVTGDGEGGSQRPEAVTETPVSEGSIRDH